jgi:nitrogen regulatory protein PII-like uncharacterized protein
MSFWSWLNLNAVSLQSFSAFAGTVLTAVTIGVLIVTYRAVSKQARAAEKLTEATERQIQLTKDQAEAAKQMVEVTKRQITESLRPILIVRLIDRIQITPGSFELKLKVSNEGAGVALDVWWMYGKPGIDPHQRNRVGEGIIPPGEERFLQVPEPIAANEGVLIVYESLSGITSGSGFDWKGQDAALTYYPELNDWAKSLLGRVLGSAPSR